MRADTHGPVPDGLADALVRTAVGAAARPALVHEGATTTYEQLLATATSLSTDLALAAGRGPVCLVPRPGPEGVALALACLLARRPVLIPSAQLPAAVLERVAARCGCRLWLGTDAGTGPSVHHLDGDEPTARPVDGDVALLLTTSGSTGTPKVVPLGTGALDRFTAQAARWAGIGEGTRVLGYSPLNFDLSLLEVWTTLRQGGTVVLAGDRAHARGLAATVAEHGVEVLHGVPLLYQLLLEAGRPLPTVRHAHYSGYAMPAPALAGLPRLLPAARLVNVYGCTETNDAFVHELPPLPDPAAPVPLGDPLPGVDALLVAPDGRALRGPGTGELWVSTPFQTRGYLDAHLAASRFGPHPDGLPGRRYFRSGDLVRRDVGGVLHLQGRVDHQVKVRGVQVNLEAVEHVLGAHPDVVECGVLASPHELDGHRLHAVVRYRPGARPDTLGLRRRCADHLVSQAVPATVRVIGTALPRTSTGKIDRKRLVTEVR